MRYDSKNILFLLLAVCLVCFGVALIITAFVVPPTGYIDPTVLTAYGETLTFVGSVMGLDYHYRRSDHRRDDDV